MAFGLTAAGFTPKRLPDLVEQMKSDLRATLGADLTFDDTAPETQLVGALADRYAEVWEELAKTYAAGIPDSAEGASLDGLLSLNLLARLGETTSKVTLRLVGVQDTAVAAGTFEASVSGNPAARFKTTEDAVLATPYNAKQTIAFTDTPASGAFTLFMGAAETASIAWNASTGAVQTALEGLSAVGAGNVTVTGSFAAGFVAEFNGAKAHTFMTLMTAGADTLLDGSSGAIQVSVEATQLGGYADDVLAEALTAGPHAAPAGKCTVIETAVTGVPHVTNPAAADIGSYIETDSAAKLRRVQSLQRPGTAPLNGIRTSVSLVTGVDTVFAFENAGSTVDGEGRPPHSVEIVVLGGADEDIAVAIWGSKAAGIETFGTETVVFTDAYGTSRTVKFSRPTEIDIYMVVEITPNTDPNESDIYPADGDDQVKAAVLAFAASNQNVGRDVVNTRYFIPVNQVAGVNGIVIKVGTAPAPASTANVVITARQVAVFDLTRITVDSTP